MVPPSKWLKCRDSSVAVSQAAEQALKMRQKTLLQYVRRVTSHKQTKIEDIHQLRVATRRAQAVLSLFAPVMPGKSSKKLIRQMRDLRRMAGPVRDLDVLMQRLTATGDDQNQLEPEQIDALLRRLRKRRAKRYEQLVPACRSALEQGLPKRFRRVRDEIDWPGKHEPSLAVFARPVLKQYVDQFLDASTHIEDVESIHQMRIEGKKVRYAWELVLTAFAPVQAKSVYDHFGEVQEKLGQINDHWVAAEWLKKLAQATGDKRTRRRLKKWARREHKRHEEAADAFRVHWQEHLSRELRGCFAKLFAEPASEASA